MDFLIFNFVRKYRIFCLIFCVDCLGAKLTNMLSRCLYLFIFKEILIHCQELVNSLSDFPWILFEIPFIAFSDECGVIPGSYRIYSTFWPVDVIPSLLHLPLSKISLNYNTNLHWFLNKIFTNPESKELLILAKEIIYSLTFFFNTYRNKNMSIFTK